MKKIQFSKNFYLYVKPIHENYFCILYNLKNNTLMIIGIEKLAKLELKNKRIWDAM
jgi:hypothetical protein